MSGSGGIVCVGFGGRTRTVCVRGVSERHADVCGTGECVLDLFLVGGTVHDAANAYTSPQL